MVSYALTELVDAIRNDNPSVAMSFVMDMYYNKEAKCPRLLWDEMADTDGSMSGSVDELSDRGNGRVESPPTEVTRESDQLVLDTIDNVTVLNPK